jgi:hypothetical protein
MKMKLVDVKSTKEFADTFLPDPILKMAVNSVLNNAPGFDLVHCSECQKSNYCAVRQLMKYEHGVDDPFCPYGERKENEI